MARKKLNELPDHDIQVPTPEETKPKPRTTKKPTAKDVATVPQTKRVAKAKATIESPEPPAAKGRTKPKAKAVVAAVPDLPAPEPSQDPIKKGPARTRRAKTPRGSQDSPAVFDTGELQPIFRPVQRATSQPASKPSEAKPSAVRFKGRGRQAHAAPSSAKEREIIHEDFVVEGDLPIPVWRAQSGTTTSKAATREVSTSEEGSGRGRRSRGRTREVQRTQELKSDDIEQTTLVPEALETPPPPATSFRRSAKRHVPPPPRPFIQTPADAPQVVLRDGLPTLVRNGVVYPPIMFFGGSADERSASTVLEELRMASDAGVHLHSHLVDLEVDPESTQANTQLAAYLLGKTVAIDPKAQVLFRLVFKAPRGWQQTYPKARFLHEDGTLAEPSVCDDEFWGAAKTCLADLVKQLRQLELAKNILGVQLDRGEWFLADGWGYDTSESATIKFREWARLRYLDDEVMLRASWFDGTVDFKDLAIPRYMPEGDEGDRFIRSSRKQRRYVDYHLFLSDATVQRIGELAYAVKEASEGHFLVGASYGYTFEWSHPASGHLSLGKMLRTPEIDFLAGPPSYRSREPGGSAPFPGPIDSFALNGKLYISEEDFKTSLSGGREPDDFNPMIKTPQALESVHWRGAGAAFAHGSGMAWMDLWGNGWLKTTSIWDRAAKVSEGLVYRMGAGLGEPEVCVFIDERALAYLVDKNAFSLLVQNVRESVLKAGVNAGFYLLSDLAHREKFPEAKLYIFLNAWDLRPDLRAAIKSRLQRDGKVLFWLYSAGLFDAGRDSLERAREVTGIALKPQPFYSKSGTTILNRRNPLCEAFPDRSLISGAKLEPSYFAIPEDALVLGEYTQTGLPSFVVKEFNPGEGEQNWTSIFLGEPSVNPALIRALAQMSGAHVWNFGEELVHVRAPFLTVHCSGTGQRAITLPSKWAAYNLLTRQWIQTDSSNLRFQANDGTTQVFLVGTQEEIEHLLSLDPEAILALATLPPKQDNTLHGDASAFDIPMMKLNEWMEGGDADEVADEWFLRPQHIELEDAPVAESETDRRTGRRRRKRGRGSSDRQGSEETAGIQREFSVPGAEDLGINVVFRKRD